MYRPAEHATLPARVRGAFPRLPPNADHAADFGCESLQIDEEEEDPERENARPPNGFPALRGCPSGCHVVLLKAICSPQRENRSSTKGMHPRFGEDERFTGEWR